MARVDRTRRVASGKADGYRDQARSFMIAAEALDALADDDEVYGAAIGLLALHACIGQADAIAISYGGRKSVGAHDQCAALLTAILGSRFPKVERQRLLRNISQKDSIAYQGRYYSLREARIQLKSAKSFARWAERMFEERP